jgi:hypothetical protein
MRPLLSELSPQGPRSTSLFAWVSRSSEELGGPICAEGLGCAWEAAGE